MDVVFVWHFTYFELVFLTLLLAAQNWYLVTSLKRSSTVSG